MSARHPFGAAVVMVAVLAVASTGCEDVPFCFDDCPEVDTDPAGSGGAGGDGSGGDGAGGDIFTISSSSVGGGDCVPSNGGVEICDELDNDCDGDVDEDFDFNGIQTCGRCDNNCLTILLNTNPNTITCDWDGTEGEAGTCNFTECAPDYHDDVNTPGDDCNYYCIQIANDDVTCNNADDDCDQVNDEDVDLCTDVNNCGACGSTCSPAHGVGECVNDGNMPCEPANTQCMIVGCDDDDNDGSPDWWNNDGVYSNGCEYPCSLTNGGIEICGDGIDNDCDGFIDGADSDLSGDPQLGQPCYGDPDGLCATPAYEGVTECVGNQVQCGGNILIENQLPDDDCDNIDDDCDGSPDDDYLPTVCGMSNVFPCSFGQLQCSGGVESCVGNVDPATEYCDGIDNDCDGVIDMAGGQPPVDAGADCHDNPNVQDPPPNVPSGCMDGTLNCQGGVLVCQGDTGPTSSVDLCGEDSNCDGVLDNQPDTMTDTNNCGMCGNDCYQNAQHEVWTCETGSCVYQGCEQGWHDLNNDMICEYACLPDGNEVCDGLDNDCNGQIDDGVPDGDPTERCGVSPAATGPECTSMVEVMCVNGSYECNFLVPGVCDDPTNGCAGTAEICDAYDNDCDGGVNETTPNFGLPCQSDEGLPPPGHGACRTSGFYVCDPGNPSGPAICSAVKEDCNNLPEGCEELCDNQDNDCDGLVDETFVDQAIDPEPAYFVRPDVTQIDTNLFMFSYEASRPNAGPTTAGSGNGYHCSGSGCPPGIPPAPAGTTLDATIACSVQGVLPWFNVTPIEAEQTCDALGGFVCPQMDWQDACEAGNNCDLGYNPDGAQCRTPFPGTQFCNTRAFDFDGNPANGIQDGLLETGSTLLSGCAADWTSMAQQDPFIFDITGNLREITQIGSNVYILMGGAYNTENLGGAFCDFDFYAVNNTFRLQDTGFRCCYDIDPR